MSFIILKMFLTSLFGNLIYTLGSQDCNIDRTGLPTDACSFELRMKGAQPATTDQYFASGYQVLGDILPLNSVNDAYIVRYEALADAGTAHHILVFGCKGLRKDLSRPWTSSVCDGGKEQIIFAWAKNAPPLSLPKDVGQHIGYGTEINYIVIQIHYVQPLQAPDTSGIRIYLTQKRQLFVSGIYLLLSYGVTIPANTSRKVISGYKVINGYKFELIGKGNPQWPQAFYPVDKKVVINPGDILAARCTYNSTGRYRPTLISSTSADEMCNFYIMYYMNATMEYKRGEDMCFGNREPYVFTYIPVDSDAPLPRNIGLEDMAEGHSHHDITVHANVNTETDIKRITSSVKTTPPSVLVSYTEINAPVDSVPVMASKSSVQFISSVGNIELGPIGGLAVNQEGELFIFHRGSNTWDYMSFDGNDRYTLQNKPIEVDTVVILNKNGTIKRHFGRNRYFLPHGLSVDTVGNIWLTDVALHQVFRIPKGADEPDLTLGLRFEPGSDDKHFCKPADVAVMSTGEFFVADGYCNSRILKFDRNGYLLKEWGTKSINFTEDGYAPPGTFNLPHGLALAEDKGLICMADRENGRIQCFDLDGNFVQQMHPRQFGKAVFAVAYSKNQGGVLFAVNGPMISTTDEMTQGFMLDINTGQLLSVFNVPHPGLRHPHDVAVNIADNEVYVGELNPNKVWKFQISQELYSTSTDRVMQRQPIQQTQNVLSMETISATKETKTEEDTGFGPSVIIGTLLVVPVILLIIITVIIRLYHTGYFKCSQSKKFRFNMGNFLNTHKGFNHLSTEDDDHGPVVEESENEDFNITRKA